MRLELRQLKKSFGAARALGGVSLSASAGAVHAVLGENGAGKSTLMKILSGAERADAGELRLDGAPFRPESPEAARRAGVSHRLPRAAFLRRFDACARTSCSAASRPVACSSTPRSSREIAARALEQVGVERGRWARDARCGELSPADRQLVSIARALSQRRLQGVDPGRADQRA